MLGTSGVFGGVYFQEDFLNEGVEYGCLNGVTIVELLEPS